MRVRHDDPARPVRLAPGQADIWAFVLFECLVFTSYFGVYMACRIRHPQLYLQSRALLDVRMGALNTIVLLLSSWSMARCLEAARSGDDRRALHNLVATAGFGSAFLVMKVVEWVEKAQEGIGLATDEFFAFYYFLTGIHFVHLLIGLVGLGVIGYQLAGPAPRSLAVVETGATYWHTVDLLWIAIFSFVYLLR
ncbi:MAG: cytochrome c oxidase subunit 3 [Myxococcales bacterium]|nr:cytochrome c oxidase subunit 3 [Myxococcales bacterium]